MPRLLGSRIMLREYKREDFQHIRKWVNESEVVDNLSDVFLHAQTQEMTEQFLTSVLKGEQQNAYHFVIADLKNEAYIGQIDLTKVDWKNRWAEMGIVIGDQENREKGLGREAIGLLQEFVFNRLNLNRLQLAVHAYNTRAYACYIKSGFKEEGRLRESFYINGQYSDRILLSILKLEYSKLQP